MTGFGAGRGRSGDEELSVEIRSVNHKFCEVKVRLPKELLPLESELTKRVKAALHRGAIDVSVNRSSPGRSAFVPRVDLALAREYLAAYETLGRELHLPTQVGVRDLAEAEGVLNLEHRPAELSAAAAALSQALDEALSGLVRMREQEGRSLAEDLRSRAKIIRALAEKLRATGPKAVEAYRERLEARIAELARGLPLEPQRLAQEVAFFSERTDIAEEITRLSSHLDQFDALLAGEPPVGRRLDFLVQEIHRELNTAGSKSQSAEAAAWVVELKAEVERVREQVQNLE